ncbi:MAG: flagellar filament capping protein FliD [Gemmatimonadota bacterium]|nr:flagellar filament capping protein FliD [Gemmatimonadota bacterium]
MTSPVATSSAPVGSFPGLGSTFDYTSLVNSMIQIQSQPGVAMQNRITSAQAQLTAYQSYSGLLTNLESTTSVMRSGAAFQGVTAGVSNATGANGQTVLSASALSGAAPGSYAVKVTQLAQAEKLSGATFSSSSAALGMSGDFIINGRTVTLTAADTLTSVRDKINAVNSGSNASNVAASIVTDSANAQRLVLTSTQTGAAGINLVDGAQGIAQQLGWIDATSAIKHVTSAGGQSDNFGSATASIGSQLGLTAAPGAQTVSIGGHTVSINLATDSLTSVAAAFSALPGVQATVQSTTVNGASQYHLDVRNTTSFTDSGNALQQLGILTAGRSSVAQQIQSSAMTDGNASTPATTSTLLTNLWNGGSASGASVGDTLSISGTRGDGSAVSISFTVASGSTVQDLLNKLNDATSGFGAGTRPATASIDAGGHITVTDGTAGQSSLALQMVANNQGGGRLDFGALGTAATGRSRELATGADAKFSVDGVAFTRSSNAVSDVIANTTMNLTAADPNVTATVTVALSSTAAQTAVQNYVSAYNAVIDYIKTQQTPGADPTTNPTLYNDTLLRSARSALAQSMLSPVAGAASDMATPDTVGISLTSDGHLTFDTSKFQSAFTNRYNDVTKLFTESGVSTNPSLVYTASTSATQPGSYAVNITQAAAQAQVLGSGFSGSYSQSGAPDTMTVTDLTSNSSAQIQLSNGMTTAQIVAALSAAFTANGVVSVTASAVGNQIQIQHNSFGASSGFAVSYSGSGNPATQLGIASGSSYGSDVQGTIGGYAATGSGRTLVGASGTPVDGMSLAYLGTSSGSIGNLTLSQGVGSVVDRLLQAWTQTGGSIDAQTQQINDSIGMQQARLTDFTARIALERAALLKQYSAMDSIVSQIRAQGNSFLAAFPSTNGSSSSSSGGSTTGTGN